MTFLPADVYALIERSMPIACVDFVLRRGGGVEGGVEPDRSRDVSPASDRVEVGLILRDSPFGRVWCHLGGRILRGESIAQALQRHAGDTLGVALTLDVDPQPGYVYQWFPRESRPEVDGLTDGLIVGDDPRKHAVGLSFVVETDGVPEPRGEAIDFGWFAPENLPEPLWPGCRDLFVRLGIA